MARSCKAHSEYLISWMRCPKIYKSSSISGMLNDLTILSRHPLWMYSSRRAVKMTIFFLRRDVKSALNIYEGCTFCIGTFLGSCHTRKFSYFGFSQTWCRNFEVFHRLLDRSTCHYRQISPWSHYSWARDQFNQQFPSRLHLSFILIWLPPLLLESSFCSLGRFQCIGCSQWCQSSVLAIPFSLGRCIRMYHFYISLDNCRRKMK